MIAGAGPSHAVADANGLSELDFARKMDWLDRRLDRTPDNEAPSDLEVNSRIDDKVRMRVEDPSRLLASQDQIRSLRSPHLCGSVALSLFAMFPW